MLSTWARALRTARVSAGLSQDDLGTRLGLKGRGQAICRWETGASSPTKRNQRAVAAALVAANADVGQRFLAAITPPAPPAPVVAPAPLTGGPALERAVYVAADELDLPPRRVRSALLRFLKRLHAGQLSVESAQPLLEGWIMNDGL